MKLFTVGPVQMYERTLYVRTERIPYFRTQEFSEMMLKTDKKLRIILEADGNCKTIYLTASGTGAMEATVMNCFGDKDKLLIINGGTFGERFETICKIHKIDYSVINVLQEEELEEERLLSYENKGYTGLLVNIHETSIGKLYNIDMLSAFCRRNGIFFVVDAISSAFIDDISMSRHNIDALIFSSQKALALSPGMSGVLLSKRILEERVENNPINSLYFDFKEYLVNFERGQTPYTPSVGTFIEFADMIDYIYTKGLEKIIQEKQKLASDYRIKIVEEGFGLPQYTMSNGLTPMYIEDAYYIYSQLKEKYNIIVTPSGGNLKDKLIRVGHMGDLRQDDYEYLINCIHKIRKNK